MTAREFLKAVANGKTDLVQVLLDILGKTRTAYCVMGGLAVNAYVQPVVSLDLDVVVISGEIERIREEAVSRGLKVERFEHSMNLSSPESELRIQLQTDRRYQAFIRRAS